jgi:hypothetical protein
MIQTRVPAAVQESLMGAGYQACSARIIETEIIRGNVIIGLGRGHGFDRFFGKVPGGTRVRQPAAVAKYLPLAAAPKNGGLIHESVGRLFLRPGQDRCAQQQK